MNLQVLYYKVVQWSLQKRKKESAYFAFTFLHAMFCYCRYENEIPVLI